MALASDYFLLYHGIHFEPEGGHSSLTFNTAQKETLQNLALLLMISRKAFDKFSALDAFETLCQSLNVAKPKDLAALHALQYDIIHALTAEGSSEVFPILQETFLRLLEEEILKKENYKKLLSLFTDRQNALRPDKRVQPDFSFPEAKKRLFEQIETLEALTEEQGCCEDVKTFLNAQTFSIGITGVMNAGKSTLINALLGEDMLGTSVVPETANLTLLQYSENPSATVVYWNQKEWQKIETAAAEIKAMQAFVEETKAAFQNDFADYVQPRSKREQIEVADLPHYTSAEKSYKKCNLVKHVVLQSRLAYLKEGVEIVDTPGLDDPVIQREEITKAYIASCDMLLHLMNVSQSATQTDVAFIVDALLYQNISKLLIVITRADTVSQNELDEVIAYTKASISEELKRVNRENRLDSVLQTLDFVAISGKMALLCRRDPERAEAQNATLEKSGILALEKRLDETLFGAGAQKSQLLIDSAQKRLRHHIEEKSESLRYTLELLSKSQEELETQWHDFVRQKAETEAKIALLEEDLKYDYAQLAISVASLEHFMHSEFQALQNVLRERVLSDVRYSFEKTKKRPEAGRIEVIVETAYKDGIIDIVRDYRYKLSQKFEALDENYRLKYAHAGFERHERFNAETFFEDAFQRGFLNQSIEVYLRQILAAVAGAKAKEIQALDERVKKSVAAMLSPVEAETKEKLDLLNARFLEKFKQFLESPLADARQKLASREAHLKSHKNESTAEVRGNAALAIHEKIKKLEALADELKGVPYVS